MANRIFDDYQGASVKINGICYKFIGETTRSVNSQPQEIEETYDSCLACAIESSSSESTQSSSSESIGNTSSSSESFGNESSSSSQPCVDCEISIISIAGNKLWISPPTIFISGTIPSPSPVCVDDIYEANYRNMGNEDEIEFVGAGVASKFSVGQIIEVCEGNCVGTSSSSSEGYSESSSSSYEPPAQRSVNVVRTDGSTVNRGRIIYDGGPLASPTEHWTQQGTQKIYSIWSRWTYVSNVWNYTESGSAPLVNFGTGNFSARQMRVGLANLTMYNSVRISGDNSFQWYHALYAWTPIGVWHDDYMLAYRDGNVGFKFPDSRNTELTSPAATTCILGAGGGPSHYCCMGMWDFPYGDHLSKAEVQALAVYLYNGGTALQYENLSDVPAYLDNMTHFWNLNEYSDGTSPVTYEDKVGNADFIGDLSPASPEYGPFSTYPISTTDFPSS